MKNVVRSLLFAAFVGASELCGAGAVTAAPKEGLLYLQVQQSRLRSQPQFWSPPLADLNYGDSALGAAPKDKSWLKVKFGDKEGYVHVSSVTSRKVIVKGSAKVSANVDPSSVVLAGKGFNKQVEGNYGASKGLNYKAVDLVEANKVESAEETAFLVSGGLATE